MTRHLLRQLVVIAAVLSPVASAARPLKLSEVHDLSAYLTCVATCPVPLSSAGYDEYAAYRECLVPCGHAPRLWEKNGVVPVDDTDLELALLEYQQQVDTTRQVICYADVERTIVVPGALCTGDTCEQMPECSDADCAAPTAVDLQCQDTPNTGPVCWWPDHRRKAECPDVVCKAQPLHTFQECADADGDTLPAWLEQALGTDDNVSNPPCSSQNPCAFSHTCAPTNQLGSTACLPRVCVGACSAFHLQRVADDDQEVIVHVHYDFTPIPARALDLFITFDHSLLTLQDARRLAPLILEQKQLATTHLADGMTTRLSVFDTAATHAIPTGPIIELVFRRHTLKPVTGPAGPTSTIDVPAVIAFTSDSALRAKAVAPLQGNQKTQLELEADAAWGPPVLVPALDQVTTRLRLWYSFDAGTAPLAYASVPTASVLCGKLASCANEDDVLDKARQLALLGELQAGTVAGGEAIAGLSGSALYLDGGSDHLRLPVSFEEPLAPMAQSVSLSLWFYGEGSSAFEQKKSPQVLMSHMAFNERSRFGLLLKPEGGDLLTLVLFSGDLLGKSPPPVEVTVAKGIAERTWHHVGYALDSATGKVDLYFDGKRVGDTTLAQPPSLISCPQFFAATNVVLHEEGKDVLGGKAPERLYFAQEQNNLASLHRTDAAGLGDLELVGDTQFSYTDPDYSPVADRLVFSANVSGSAEIWMAHADGSHRTQVTQGFGDAFLGFSARRPRWAPDGSGIVFDSNAFDAFTGPGDNDDTRGRHLYYVPYDPTKPNPATGGVGALTTPDGAVLTTLAYPVLVANGSIGAYRLTNDALSGQQWNAHWLTGKGSPAEGQRGELLHSAAAGDLKDQHVARIAIDAQPGLSKSNEVTGLRTPEQTTRLLAARHVEKPAVPQPIVAETLLFERGSQSFEVTSQFGLQATTVGTTLTLAVLHQPNGHANGCWDTNFNTLDDVAEDLNGDGSWTVDDCMPVSVRNLFIEFDAKKYLPVLETAQGGANAPGALLGPLAKTLKLGVEYPDGRAFVRVEVLSALNTKPLPAGELARLQFTVQPEGVGAVAFAPFVRTTVVEWFTRDLLSAAAPQPFDSAGMFESMTQAAFSPAGDRLLLLALSGARPVLLRTESLSSAANAKKLPEPTGQVTGLDWERRDGYMACNWVGGVLHPQTKALQWGLRGGLDDVKLYAGLRDPDAFRSEAERGRAFLSQAGLSGQVASKLPSCTTSHLECPPYTLCVDATCKMVACDASEPTSCHAHGGRCTLRPLDIEQETTGPKGEDPFAWVCAADCAVDKQCFEQECKNGPCRFCDAERQSCIECRNTVQTFGALSLTVVEGCPDQKSFRCEAGSCVSDCYTSTGDQTVYLCDPALQYCQGGRCVLHDWDWWDLGPASFAGGTATERVVPKAPTSGWNGYTMSVDQRISIALKTYGVSDYGSAPHIVVEARGGPFYGGTWQRVGEAIVQATTQAQAQQRPIVLSSPWVFDALRLRLVTPPYDNLAAAGTGLGANDKDFCVADLQATAAATGETADPSRCTRRAQGSRYWLGYGAELPTHDAAQACQEHGLSACLPVHAGEHDYIDGGAPAAVVLDVEVDGASVMNNITHDTICAYGDYGPGAVVPFANGAPKKVLYGDISTEQSPQQTAFCATPGVSCQSPGASGLVEFPHAQQGKALLNCNVVDPAHGDETAAITMDNIIIPDEWPARSGAITLDTGDACMVEVNAKLTTPCYEWQDGKVSLDPNLAAVTSGDSVPQGTLDFGLFTSFGHDEGFDLVPLPKFPLKAVVEGYQGVGLRLRCGGKDVVPVAAGGAAQTIECGLIKLGRKIDVAIRKQPTAKDHQCGAYFDPEQTRNPSGDRVANVICGTMYKVGGTVGGLDVGKAVKLRGKLTITPGADGIFGVELLAVANNGAFTFATPLAAGGAYDVTVKTNPPGQVCTVASGSGPMEAAPVSSIAITCKKAVPHSLGLNVSGLVGTGLEVLEKTSGATLGPTGNGLHAFAPPRLVSTPYEIAITGQPTGPTQVCEIVSGGKGTMPDADVVGASISCAMLSTYPLPVHIIGHLSAGLVLELNGKELLAVPPGQPGETTVSAFETTLVAGAAYSVVVTAQPEAPAEVCKVLAGTGTGTMTAGTLPAPVTIACLPGTVDDQNGEKGLTIGGTVSGLQGTGLRLKLLYGVDTLDISKNGKWTFKKTVKDQTDYFVEVVKQPSNPWQVCTIADGLEKGELVGKNVDDIAITCVLAAPVTVEVTSLASDGAQVSAVLIGGAKGTVVARSRTDIKLKKGKAVFTLADVATDSKDALMTAGEYALYLFVNHDGSVDKDTGGPSYNGGDVGAWKKVKVDPTGPPKTEKFAASPPAVPADVTPVVPLWSARVLVSKPMEKWISGDLRCWWGTAGLASAMLPLAPLAPVVATAYHKCFDVTTDSPVSCYDHGDTNQPSAEIAGGVPAGGVYDVTCWVDVDKSGTVTKGDWRGTKAGLLMEWNFFTLPITLPIALIEMKVMP